MIRASPFTLLKNFGTAGCRIRSICTHPTYGFTGDAVLLSIVCEYFYVAAGDKPPPYGFTGDAVLIIHCMQIFYEGAGDKPLPYDKMEGLSV